MIRDTYLLDDQMITKCSVKFFVKFIPTEVMRYVLAVLEPGVPSLLIVLQSRSVLFNWFAK